MRVINLMTNIGTDGSIICCNKYEINLSNSVKEVVFCEKINKMA
jgi:hypothetical protein